MSNNEVMGELLKADWVDVGTPERLAELNKMSS
jgi:NDP-sugar pyrophosphorylase family protein